VAPQLRGAGAGPGGPQAHRGAVPDDPRRRAAVRGRHPGPPRPHARAGGRGGRGRGPPRPALRGDAQGGALLALAVRQPRHRVRAQDARRAGGAGGPRAALRLRGRDARGTRRWTPRCATGCSLAGGSRGRPTS
jgi:hypothetical protein